MVKKRQNTESRQEQIIDAARKLVVKYGSEHVTVGRIAREVGISEGAIYRHFKSKRDVLSGLADHIAEDLLKDITSNKSGSSTALVIIDNALRNHLSSIQQRRGISFQVIAEILSFGDKKLNRKISEIIEKYVNTLKELLSRGVKTGELRKDADIDAAAILLFGMIQGLVNIWALGNYNFNLEERYSQLWKTFLKSIVSH
jgi:AcrR family transcriptional regulator